jgi:hypothetical protein
MPLTPMFAIGGVNDSPWLLVKLNTARGFVDASGLACGLNVFMCSFFPNTGVVAKKIARPSGRAKCRSDFLLKATSHSHLASVKDTCENHRGNPIPGWWAYPLDRPLLIR